jgi:drug/metabolite transporter (DMT)-like permease
MLEPEKRAWLELHFAVLCFGFTAILGVWISLSALNLVWWRVLITSVSLIILMKGARQVWLLPKRLILQYAGIGVLVALHWIAFYGAVKISNVSITLVCLATTSLFTAFLEPLIMKRPILRVEVLLGLLVIPGMMLVVSQIEASHWAGVAAGLASALFAAIFSILNKKLVTRAKPMEITLIELGSSFIFISMILGVMLLMGKDLNLKPTNMDWVHLMVLSLLCTTLAYILTLRALQHLTAFASNLTINLEPVYGIILAILLLGEHKELTISFYIGVFMILMAVISYPYLKKKIAV